MDFTTQSSNKDFEFFQPAFTDPYDDLFDQYVMMDPFDSSDDSIDQRIDMSFEATTASDSSDPAGTSSPNPNWDVRHTESEEPWRTTLWPLNQSAALPFTTLQGSQSAFYRSSDCRATISDTELHSLEGFSDFLIHPVVPPSSPPSTPSLIPSRSRPRTGFKSPRGSRHTSNDRRKANCRNSPSPVMMSAARHQTDVSTFQSSLHDSHAVARTNPQTPSNRLPLSPPPSAKVSEFDYQKQPIAARQLQPESLQWQAYDHTASSGLPFTNIANVQLSSPFVDTYRQQKEHACHHNSASSDNISYPSTPYTHEALNSIETPPTTQPLSPSCWAPQSASGALDFEFELPTELQSTPTQPWWFSGASACTSQPSSSAYQHPASPTEQDASRSLMHLTLDSTPSNLATQGLMINCGQSVNEQLVNGANGIATHDYFGASSSSQPFSSYTEQTSARRSHHRHCPSTSRSPSLSPTSQSRRSSKTPRTPTTPSHHRRKSSSTTPTSASLGGGFVNFTPHDSRKILGGVAPSGSSKTKARREKEAEIKRRKLSEAAVRAVKEAGGDLGGLESVLDGC